MDKVDIALIWLSLDSSNLLTLLISEVLDSLHKVCEFVDVCKCFLVISYEMKVWESLKSDCEKKQKTMEKLETYA